MQTRLLCCLISGLLAVSARAQVVINEIHYKPADRSKTTEFVELRNTTAAVVDLAGWKFDSGIAFTFPVGSTIAANGYLVLAADTTAFQTEYGFAPFGAYTGGLSNSGEELRLRTAANATIEDVTYGVGFPWPTTAHGDGPSLELINPALDRNLGGSWRSSGSGVSAGVAQDYILAGDGAPWHYRKGTSEASSPVDAWRQPGFVEDATWLSGPASIGYGDSDDNTILTDMLNNYSSIYLRRIFTIPLGQVPGVLKLSVRVDDGCVVWINGTEVARFHVPATGTLPFNGFATDHEAGSVFEEVTIPNSTAFLHEGDNVIAIHALNSAVDSSDFTIEAKLSEMLGATSTAPTPGAQNSVYSAQAPPAIRQVLHTPNQPLSGQDVTITAKITDPDGMGAVSLSYQLVDPGSYIRGTDAAYATNWTSVPMYDDGTNGDALAGDGIYTAVLPGALQTHRRLVRYRITAADRLGSSVRVPYADDSALNFAYFVYNGVPDWSGAFIPGTTSAVTYPSSLLTSLPTYQLIANASDVTNSQYISSYNNVRFPGTFIYNGKVFDHILFNNRGEASTYTSGKNKWRIRFNNTRDLQALDNWGRPYAETWDTLNLNACASPWVPIHRGMGGIEEAMSARIYELLGSPSPRNHFLHFRVIDDAAESPGAASQFSGGDPAGVPGDLWGLYLAVENPDGSFIDERNMADGNVYKIEASTGDRKHQGSGQPSDGSDWTTFLAGCRQAGQTEAWWRANLDLPAYYNFHTVNRIVGNIDLRDGYNHFFYHNPDGHWTVIPWDLDMMFVARTHQPTNATDRANINIAGTIDQRRALINFPAIRTEFQNRAREVLDLLLADVSVTGGQIGQLVDEYAQFIHPSGQSLTWTELDAAMWNKNPRTTANHNGNFWVTPLTGTWRGGSWTRTLATPDFAGSVRFLKEYMTNTYGTGAWTFNNGQQLGYGYKFLETEAADTAIPNQPTATYSGPVGYPLNDLRFSTSAFSDPQGAGTFSTIQWRIAEISAPGIPLYDSTKPRIYEVSDLWRSPEIASTAGQTRIPATGMQPGHTYRVRVRHKDNTARWSRWSPAVQFVAGAADASLYQQNLIISEIMYNPGAPTGAEISAGFSDADDFEFIALKNIGNTTLDLSGVSFTAGITFSFPAGATLAAGATTLLVKNLAAFNLRYGSGKSIAGVYSDKLSNGGETLTLTYGAASTIYSFAFDDEGAWPTEPDGGGYSLVLVNQNAMPNFGLASSWRASRKPKGSPGVDDTVTYSAWAAAYPGIGAGSANADADALTNLEEYAQNTNPKALTPPPVAATQFFTVNAVAAPYLTYTFRRQIGATDLTFHIQFSSDLSGWTEDGVRVSSTLNGDGSATEVWRASTPATGASQFVRLLVTSP
jgi:hypothetical protein